MEPRTGAYLVVEAAILLLVGIVSFTVLNNEYLFGWVAHNWKFYLILAGIPVLLLGFGWRFMSAELTAGIVLGLFGGNYNQAT